VKPHGTAATRQGRVPGPRSPSRGPGPLSVGTETDGSIVSRGQRVRDRRLKPTLGLVSRSGIVPITPEQDNRLADDDVVADAPRMLDGLAGADPADEASQGQTGRRRRTAGTRRCWTPARWTGQDR